MNTDRLTKLKDMEARQPADAFLKYAIGLEYLNAGQQPEAAQQFALLMEQFPAYVPTYYQAGKLYEETGDVDKAAAVYNKGMEIAQAAGDHKTCRELKEALTLLNDE